MTFNLKEALRSLYAAKQRTLLALIGISIGVGSVIAMVSISRIVKEQAISEFRELGPDILTISKDYDEDTVPRQAFIALEDALKLPDNARSIASVAPFLSAGHTVSYGGKSDYGNVLGITQSYAQLNRLRLREGRFISDLDTYRYFCVVGARMEDRLHKMGVPRALGSSIKIAGHLFIVIGVLESSPSPGILPYQTDESILIPISTALRFFENTEISSITARTHSGASHPQARVEVQSYFHRRMPNLNISVNSAEEIIRHMESQIRLFTLLSAAIGSISLLVGGIGVMNVMLISTAERRTEIGLRRALGARRGDIQSQFLIESLVLSLLGGVIGVLLGTATAYVAAFVNDWPFFLSYASVLLGVGVSGAVGVFFGFYPAYQAARLDPIAALRVK